MPPQKHVWRAQIVVLSADSVGTNQIMRETGKAKTCVWRWQERFAIDAVKQEGLIDNTLIIFIEGDNGGSAEGTLQGTANEVAIVGNGSPESFDYLYSIKD